MIPSKSSSESSLTSSLKTGSSAMDGCESPDLEWKKTGSLAAVSSLPSSSDASSSAVDGAPLPGPAAHQIQQPRPNDISHYGSTYAITNSGQTVLEFPRQNQ